MQEKHYKIGELAAIAKVSAKAIRIYEQKGILTSCRDEQNGYRYFPESAVVSMQRIQMLKYLGSGLDDIRTMMQHYEQMDLRSGPDPTGSAYSGCFFNHVASYMEEPAATYSRLKSYLLPGGKFIATWGGFLLIEKLTELLCEYDPVERKKIIGSAMEMKTLLEQKEEELKQVFGEVELRKYSVNLYFENTKEMADYLEYFAKNLGVNIADNMPQFERFLEERFGGKPKYAIARDAYLYVCRV